MVIFNPIHPWLPALLTLSSSLQIGPLHSTSSNPTLDSINKICETTSNLTAGKTISKSNKRFILHPGKHNLSPSQFCTLQLLRNDPNIIIKPADKGGATVVLPSHLYQQEVLRQLNNPSYYTLLPSPLIPDTAQEIILILDQLLSDGFITSKQHKFLSPQSYNVSS